MAPRNRGTFSIEPRPEAATHTSGRDTFTMAPRNRGTFSIEPRPEVDF